RGRREGAAKLVHQPQASAVVEHRPNLAISAPANRPCGRPPAAPHIVGAQGAEMAEGLRRLWLGVFLLVGVSVGLLLFDRGGRRGGGAAPPQPGGDGAVLYAGGSGDGQP